MIEVWYPAETTHGFRRARYRDGRESDYKDSSLALVNTRSFLEAPLAKRTPHYPVLLFTGPFNRFQNTFETEEMASHGFIVVGIDHPYDSDLVVFPDGRRISAGHEAGYLDLTSDDALARSRVMVERRLAVRVADTEYVLDQLKLWNESDRNRFFGRLDMSHIGMMGHSFGGAVTAEVCRADPRVRAGLNMDGTLFGTAKREGVPKPFFFMFDPTPRPDAAELESPNGITRRGTRELQGDYDDLDRSLGRYGGYFLQVPGLEHMNFSDYALYSQLKAWTGAGTIGIRRAHEMLNRVTLAFFRRELLHDRSASVEAILRDYPEAALRRQSPPARLGR
jgi:pimeloyl-ACP methyl ester carboxylesterase